MTLLYLLLLFAAAICFGVSAFFTTPAHRVNLVALGLLCWVLVPFLVTMDSM